MLVDVEHAKEPPQQSPHGGEGNDGKKVDLYKRVSNSASHFSYGERKENLKKACDLAGCAKITPDIDENGTRMETERLLILSKLEESHARIDLLDPASHHTFARFLRHA